MYVKIDRNRQKSIKLTQINWIGNEERIKRKWTKTIKINKDKKLFSVYGFFWPKWWKHANKFFRYIHENICKKSWKCMGHLCAELLSCQLTSFTILSCEYNWTIIGIPLPTRWYLMSCMIVLLVIVPGAQMRPKTRVMSETTAPGTSTF